MKVITAIIEVTTLKFELKTIVGVLKSLDIGNKTARFEILIERGRQPQRVNNPVIKVIRFIVKNDERVVNAEALYVLGRRLRDRLAIDGSQTTTARITLVTTMATLPIV